MKKSLRDYIEYAWVRCCFAPKWIQSLCGDKFYWAINDRWCPFMEWFGIKTGIVLTETPCRLFLSDGAYINRYRAMEAEDFPENFEQDKVGNEIIAYWKNR